MAEKKTTTVTVQDADRVNIADFLRAAVFYDMYDFMTMEDAADMSYSSDDAKYFMKEIRPTLNLIHKLEASSEEGAIDITFDSDDKEAFINMVDLEFFNVIRKDENIDNPAWAYAILELYEQCRK